MDLHLWNTYINVLWLIYNALYCICSTVREWCKSFSLLMLSFWEIWQPVYHFSSNWTALARSPHLYLQFPSLLILSSSPLCSLNPTAVIFSPYLERDTVSLFIISRWNSGRSFHNHVCLYLPVLLLPGKHQGSWSLELLEMQSNQIWTTKPQR